MIRTMIPYRRSIGFRLFAISMIVLALPLLVDSFILLVKGYHNRIDLAKSRIESAAELRALPVSQLQPIKGDVVAILHRFLKFEDDFPEKATPKLTKMLDQIAEQGDFLNAAIIKLTPDGRYIFVDTVTARQWLIGQDYTDFFLMNDLYSPENLRKGYTVYFDRLEGKANVAIAHPIYSEKEKRYVGFLVLVKQISEKLQTLLVPEQVGYTINFALLAPSSMIIEASDPNIKYQYFSPLSERYLRGVKKFESLPPHTEISSSPLPVEESTPPFMKFTWKGETQIGYVVQFSDADYTLLAYASQKAILRAPFIDFMDMYGVYGLILLVGGTLAYFVMKRMTTPMENLSHVMDQIRRGHLESRYQEDFLGYEINVLGDNFNEMVEAILNHKKIAEEERLKKEVYARELSLGQQVQKSLLPQTIPTYPEIEVSALYIPAILVGGDFYDYFPIANEEILTLAIGDASGKGVQACFYSLSLLNKLRNLANEYQDVAKTLEATNQLLCEDTKETGMFITLLLGMYERKTKELHYFSCGHNPLFLRRKDKTVLVLNHGSMALGVIPGLKASTKQFQLQEGDTLLFYTDGITEAHNEHAELFGEERLKDFLIREGDHSGAIILERLIAEVKAFAGHAPQHDDITLLILKVVA